MDAVTIARLFEINRRFYQEFGPAFAATRRRLQPGVRRLLERLPAGRWLDLGCGSGSLAAAWAASGKAGSYTGLDFSASLLDEAHRSLQGGDAATGRVLFVQADLADPAWARVLQDPSFDVITAFAVLHHLPSAALRLEVLRQVRTLLAAGGLFAHSEWQFQHSPKLWARRQPWEKAGIVAREVEEGDTLLDWRYALPGQAAQTSLRYVHLFNPPELETLAQLSGFEIVETFASDGEGGRLGLYQVWRGQKETLQPQD